MDSARAPIASDPRRFGRGPLRALGSNRANGWKMSDELQLFGATFAAGFLFVSILIA